MASCSFWTLRRPFVRHCGFVGASLRLRGKNLTETEHVKLGAYHTVELEPQRAFTLEKQAWDAIDIERIHQSTDPAASADLAAVLITVSTVFALCTCSKAPRHRFGGVCRYDS